MCAYRVDERRYADTSVKVKKAVAFHSLASRPASTQVAENIILGARAVGGSARYTYMFAECRVDLSCTCNLLWNNKGIISQNGPYFRSCCFEAIKQTRKISYDMPVYYLPVMTRTTTQHTGS